MSQPEIVIVDYGIGNVYSVSNAIKYLGYQKVKISRSNKDISNADALILPGVGAFEVAINNLREHQLQNILGEEVLINKKPILGICVGMQMLATTSEENGIHKGLNWIPGNVVKLNLPLGFAVPHVGWNDVSFAVKSPLFGLLSEYANFYFDHSYHFQCDEQYMSAWCDYGIKVVSAVQNGNVFGVQFHPEKSQNNGLRIFRSFFNSIS